MQEEKPIVMFSSDEAAYKAIVDGWVSRHGRFCGNDERMARYDGCTHTACERCGKPAPKGWTVCDECHEQKDIEKYAALERKEWDGEGMIYSDAHDKFFLGWEEVDDLIEDLNYEKPDSPVTIESLRLLICEPQFAREVDIDYWADDLPEDNYELPDEIQEALDNLNKAIRENKTPLSWIPGNFAVKIPERES